MTLSAAEVDRLKLAPTDEEILSVVRERWSPRSFSDRAVDTGALRTIFAAARWAPSSSNEQPWRFLVGSRSSETFEKIGSSLLPSNQSWALSAPILILGVARQHFSHNNAPNPYAIFDLGAASGFITLQAAALGIRTHQMAGFDRAIARLNLGIPDDFELGSVMALGYQGEPSALPTPKMLAQEIAPRTRRPLSEIVLGAWGEPANLG